MEEFEDSKLPPLPGMSYETPAASKHAVCNYPSGCGRSTLHRAVCEMDIIAVQRELATIQSDGVEKLTGKDDAGFCPIHSACALGMLNSSDRQGVAIEIVRQLITAGADPSSRDEKGNTPLHWAARAGDRAVADLLVSKGCVLGKWLKLECPRQHFLEVLMEQSHFETCAFLLENRRKEQRFRNTFALGNASRS